MNRRGARAALSIPLVLAPLVLLADACARPPEQQFLSQFFRAARARDAGTTASMAAVEFNPRTQGVVEDFSVVSVGVEQRAPLSFAALIAAADQARAAEEEFQRQKKVYSDANLKTIEEVLKLERTPNPKYSPQQTAVKTVWDKWRADTASYVKAVSEARSRLSAATAPAEASLTQPGQPPFDPKAFQGEMVTKDVVVRAQVRSPQDQVSEKDLTITMSRVVGTMGGTPREGKWIITRITGV
jgi:hypothetical protein